MVDTEAILRSIPESSASPLQTRLVDLILKSKNASALPAGVAKSLLRLYHDDRLASPEGLRILLEASIILEREKTAEKLQEMNLNDAAAKVKGE